MENALIFFHSFNPSLGLLSFSLESIVPLPMFLFNLYALQSFQSVLGIRNTCPLEGGYLQFCSVSIHCRNNSLQGGYFYNSTPYQFIVGIFFWKEDTYRFFFNCSCPFSVPKWKTSCSQPGLLFQEIFNVKELFVFSFWYWKWAGTVEKSTLYNSALCQFFWQKKSFLKYGLYEDRNAPTTCPLTYVS